MDFNLSDLSPRGCEIEIVGVDDEVKRYRLRKFTIATQIWIREEWGSAKGWQDALNPKSDINIKTDSLEYIKCVCKTIHHLLDDKTDFPNWEAFSEAAGCGPSELINLDKALMVTMGLSQGAIDKAVEGGKKKVNQQMKAPMKKATGRK